MWLHGCSLSKSINKKCSQALCSRGRVLNWIRALIQGKNKPQKGRGAIFNPDQFLHLVQPQNQFFWHKRGQDKKGGGRTCLRSLSWKKKCLNGSGLLGESAPRSTRSWGQAPRGLSTRLPLEQPSPPQGLRLTTHLSSGRETGPASAGRLSALLRSPSGCCTQPPPSAPRQRFPSRTSACPLARGEGKRSQQASVGISPQEDLKPKPHAARVTLQDDF